MVVCRRGRRCCRWGGGGAIGFGAVNTAVRGVLLVCDGGLLCGGCGWVAADVLVVVAFGATGAVGATVAAAIVPVCVACDFEDPAAVSLTVAWAVALASPVAGAAVTAPGAGALASITAGAGETAAAAAADWLAAIAAAAMASGAVPLPAADESVADEGVAGVLVTGTMAVIATAIGLGTTRAVPSCGAGAAELLVESAVEPSPDDDCAADVAESSLEPVDFVRER
jgi:hypothetical protein